MLHKVTHGPHAGKVLIKPMPHKSPNANHATMHTHPAPMPMPKAKKAPAVPAKRLAKKTSGAPSGFKVTAGVVGSGKHASPYTLSHPRPNGYSGKHRKGGY